MLQEKSYKLSLNLKDFLNGSPPGLVSFIRQLKCLGGFVPLKDEVDWSVHWPFKAGVTLAFPSFTKKKGGMTFVVSSFEDLSVKKQFGVKIPKANAPAVLPDVLLVPGRAFTPGGDRLGRGQGFYDRYLADFPGLKMGVCYNEQIVRELPLKRHDIPMDCVLTDQATFIGGKIWN